MRKVDALQLATEREEVPEQRVRVDDVAGTVAGKLLHWGQVPAGVVGTGAVALHRVLADLQRGRRQQRGPYQRLPPPTDALVVHSLAKAEELEDALQ